MDTSLTILGTKVRQDAHGRFCLTDLHRSAVAAGEDYKRCQVEHFLRNDSTQALANELRENGELEFEPIASVAGRYGGTYVAKELVYAYGMWISPAFHLRVIRAFDNLVQGRAPAAFDVNAVLDSPAAMRGLLLTYTEKVLTLQAEVSTLAPKAEALDRIATAEGSLCLTETAKALQVRPKALIGYLNEHRWIYRRPGSGHWLGYQDRTSAGDLEHKVKTVLRADGSEKITEQVRVTPKGLAKLAKLLKPAVQVVPQDDLLAGAA